MKKIYTLIFILILCAQGRAQQKVYLDNENIQQYNGRLGKWILIDSRKAILNLTSKISTDINDIFSLNSININDKKFFKKYYFIPYSTEYLNELEKKNIKREFRIYSEKDFIWPITNAVKTSSVLGFRNGKFHPGLDLPVQRGTPIIASKEGLVIFTGYAPGYGRIIVIEHENNFKTKYAHNSVNFVKKGDFVKKGQIIALAGSTGNSTGNHLHFELRCMNIPLDPLDFLPQNDNLRIIHTLKNWK